MKRWKSKGRRKKGKVFILWVFQFLRSATEGGKTKVRRRKSNIPNECFMKFPTFEVYNRRRKGGS